MRVNAAVCGAEPNLALHIHERRLRHTAGSSENALVLCCSQYDARCVRIQKVTKLVCMRNYLSLEIWLCGPDPDASSNK